MERLRSWFDRNAATLVFLLMLALMVISDLLGW